MGKDDRFSCVLKKDMRSFVRFSVSMLAGVVLLMIAVDALFSAPECACGSGGFGSGILFSMMFYALFVIVRSGLEEMFR